MSEEKTDKDKKKEEASKEFSGIMDATSEFLKKIFPFAYTLIDKLSSKKQNKE